MAQEIVVKIVSDVSDLLSTIDTLEQLGVVEKGVAEAFRTANASAKAQQEQLKSVGATSQQASSDVNKLAANVKNASATIVNSKADQAIQNIAGELGTASFEAKELQTNFESLGSTIGERLSAALDPTQLQSARTQLESLFKSIESGALTGEDAVRELQSAIQKVSKDIDPAQAQVLGNVLKRDFEQATGSATTFRTRLQEIKNDLTTLIENGQTDSPLFKQLTQEAAELQDKIQDVNTTIRNLASDTSSLDALLQGAQAVAGGFAVAQGAAALFGDENEEIQKSILKVQAALSILNGIQGIANALQKESALALQTLSIRQAIYNFVVTGSIKGAKALSVEQKAAALATEQQAAGTIKASLAQRAAAISTTFFSGALKVLRGAVVATGIGALVIGAIALIQNFDKVAAFAEKVADKFLPLRITIDALTSAYNFLKKAILAGTDAIGLTDTVGDALRESLTKQIEAVKKHGVEVQKNYDNEIKLAQAAGKETVELEIKKSQARANNANQQLALFKKLQDAGEELTDEQKQTIEDLKQEVTQAGVDQNVIITQQQTERLAKDKEAHEKRVQQEKDLTAELAKVRQNLELQALPDNQKELAQVDIKYETLRVKAQNNKEQLLEIERLYVKEREQILQKQSISTVEKQYKAEVDSANAFYQLLIEKEKQRFVNKEISQEQLNTNIQNLETDNVNELINIDTRYAGETETIDKQITENRRKNLDKQVQDAQKAEKRKLGALQDEADAYKDFYQDSSQIFAFRLLALDKALDAEKSLLDKQREQGIISEQQYQDALTKLTADGAKARIEIASEGLKQVLQTVEDLIQQSLQQEQEALDISQQQEVEALDERQQDKIDVLESQNARGLISETQYQSQLSALRKQQDAQDKALQKKQDTEKKALQLKAAQQKKAFAVFQATIDAASAIMQISADPSIPVPAKPFFIAAAGILSAAQIAAIIAAPLPKFAKGTEKVTREHGEPVGVDTVPALLNEGERVVDTARNIRLKGITNEELVKIVEKHFVTQNTSMPVTSVIKELLSKHSLSEKTTERLDVFSSQSLSERLNSISSQSFDSNNSIFNNSNQSFISRSNDLTKERFDSVKTVNNYLFQPPVLQTFRMKEIPEHLLVQPSEQVATPEIDYKKIGKEVAKAIKDNPHHYFSLDEKGFIERVVSKHQDITIKGNKRKGG